MLTKLSFRSKSLAVVLNCLPVCVICSKNIFEDMSDVRSAVRAENGKGES